MKMFSKQLFSLILICFSMEAIKCDQMCESLVPDAITRLQNGSIVVFREKDVWLFDREEKQLSGPCPISELFEGISGPVDAAVTFESHESVTEFVGAGLYFSEGNFYAFKNLRPYQVEWGALVYLPVHGKQDQMGSQSEEGKSLMTQKLSAAYFDPITSRSKFIFPDNSVLGFNFELGSEYDTPEVSTLESEFEMFGVSELPKSISAALTVRENKKSKVFLFDGSEFCQILIDVKKTDQKCDLKPVSEFFDCKSLKPIKSVCSQPKSIQGRFPNQDNPIQVQTQTQEVEMTVSPEAKQTVRVRDSVSDAKLGSPEPFSGSNCLYPGYVLIKVIPFLLFSLFV